MTGEVLYFRKRFIGGFNRDDVVAYISKISTERNEALAAKEEYQARVEKLNELVSENCMKREETERELAQLRSENSELREQLDNYKYLERESYNLVTEPEPTPEPELPMTPISESELTPNPTPEPTPTPELTTVPTSEPELTMASTPAITPDTVPEPEPAPVYQESNKEKQHRSVLKIKLAKKRRT